MAGTLRNLATHLLMIGNAAEALAAAEEAVNLCRNLTDDSLTHQPDLAWLLATWVSSF